MTKTETTREEHLAWCKKRALEYVDRHDVNQAFASMASDMQKHPGTAGHSALALGMELHLEGYLKTEAQMREFIEGFN